MSSEKDPSTLQKLYGIFQPKSHVLLLIRRLTKSKLHDFKVYKHFISLKIIYLLKLNYYQKDKHKLVLPEETGTHWYLLLLTKPGGC